MTEPISSSLEVFVCPQCGSDLEFGREIRCPACKAIYPFDPESQIPLLFRPNTGWTNKKDVTDQVKAFYEQDPFPNYDDFDSRYSLEEKASQGLFARLFTEQVPRDAFVLEVGCGTGQLTNFLALRPHRTVFGTDMCLNSLRMASRFSRQNFIRAGFVQMNLFHPAFRPETFDVVLCNGVLHHTGDPQGGFSSIARLVKPGGVILFGLYNRIGRLPTDFRRFLFRALGDRLKVLDDHQRNETFNAARKRSWFRDQYKHPHESKHSFCEAIQWLNTAGFQYLMTIPKISGAALGEQERLFEVHDAGNRLTKLIAEFDMLFGGGKDGALFITIGRKSEISPELVSHRSETPKSKSKYA